MNSVELLREALIDEAIALSLQNRDERWLAWVAEPGMAEVPDFAGVPDAIKGSNGSIAVFMTRESAKRAMAANCPQMLEWMPDEGEGLHRILPVIHSARQGYRAVGIPYDLPF